MKNMSEISARILKCIEDAHTFSAGLGGSNSIMRDYLSEKLVDLNSNEIHHGLIELTEMNIIVYDSFSGLIEVK